MNSIVIGGGSYDIGKVLLEERARRAQLESERQRMQMQAAAQSQQMQQNAAADAMAMRQFEAKMRFDQEKQAFDQQIENAKLAETERYRGVNDQRARQEFDAKMAFSNAQLGSLNEDRARRGDEFTRGLKQEEELKKQELEQKSKAAAMGALRANAKREYDKLALRREQVRRDLSRSSTTREQQLKGERYLNSLDQDMLNRQNIIDAGEGDIPQASTNMDELASWQGEVASEAGKVAADEKKRKVEQETKEDTDKHVQRVLSNFKGSTPEGLVEAIKADPEIPNERKETISKQALLSHPFLSKAVEWDTTIRGATDPLWTVDQAISQHEKYLSTSPQLLTKKISAIEARMAKGEQSPTDEAELKNANNELGEWLENDKYAKSIGGGGAMSRMLSRFKALRTELNKDPKLKESQRQRMGQAAVQAEQARVQAANLADLPRRNLDAQAADVAEAMPEPNMEALDMVPTPGILPIPIGWQPGLKPAINAASRYVGQTTYQLDPQRRKLLEDNLLAKLRGSGLTPAQIAVRMQAFREQMLSTPTMEYGPAALEALQKMGMTP